MTSIGESVATNVFQRLVDKTIKEARYFISFDDHVYNFVIENNSLVAKRNKVQKNIEDAQRNENEVEDEVQNWIMEADIVIQENTKIKQTWSYGWCPYWKYQQGKSLAKRTLIVKDHIQRYNFERVARPGELPGMKYHASKDYIDFESRKSKFKQLVEALEGGNHYMIGLQGMGGTGKTTLATQVGKQVEESKVFEKVIFVVVSNPPDVNKIRGEIARQLGLRLEDRVQEDHSKLLWSRISKNERKSLIILDDVWEKLDLTVIGIPSGLDQKNCYVLITTRYLSVCREMRCQPIVQLQILDKEDALHLFLFHATSDDDGSLSNDVKGLARAFVKESGGLPVAIIALASTLRSWPIAEWNAALTTLRNSKPFIDVDKDLVTVYKCLKLSYDNLKDEKARRLFLVCSIFPEDYEIPINLILRLGTGIFGEFDEYCAARSQSLGVKNKLIASSLLLEVEKKECVKMHDLVREVAHWIAEEDIQVIMDSRTTLKANKRYAFWSAYDFPDKFDDTKLEILFLWISGSDLMKDSNAFFARMSRLKILFLLSEHGRKAPTPSLSQSLLSLKNIHTLILYGWEIGNISVLKSLQSLVTLELKNCLIIELPKDIQELEKLRWLGLRKCEIQKNNPFEVIEKCSQLEELYFVSNCSAKDWKPEDGKEIDDEIAADVSPPKLQVFFIACDGLKSFTNDDNGLSKCFNSEHMKHLISKAMFKYLVGRSEVLELGNLGKTGWKSLVPDIIPMEDGIKDNLMKLYLYEWADIECLIDSNKCHCSNLTVFLNLVELYLYEVDVEELCRGGMPSGFLEKLRILKLEGCMKLQNIFSNENLKLPRLKILKLKDCPMFQPSIFKPSVAQSLGRLEKLVIEYCKELKSLIAYESSEEEMKVVDYQKHHGLLFPALESLQIIGCDKLEVVSSFLLAGDLPKLKDLGIYVCAELKYIFGEYKDNVGQVVQQEIMLPLLTQVRLQELPSFINIFQKCKTCVSRPPHISKEDSKERHKNLKTRAFSWSYGCCFQAPVKDATIGVSNAPLLEDCTISQESCALNKRIETFHSTECLVRQSLSLQNIRLMTLWKCSKLKSLFSASIATIIMLEKLYVRGCEGLKHIITNEAEDDDVHLNCTSIFPKLQSLEVCNCNKLEFIFPSNLSSGLQKLTSIYIRGAHGLKYIFGKYDDEDCQSNENENNEPHIHLPALETLDLSRVPNMISIGIKEHQPECPSLHIIEAPKESCALNERIKTFHSTECLMKQPLSLQNIRLMTLWKCSKLTSLFSVSIATTIMLENLFVEECEELKHIITNEAEDDDTHLNCTSIFPKLQSLNVRNCNKLEFIFPSILSGGLQKLKSIYIYEAHGLKHIFGKYDDEDCQSNENESNESHIHLPALESLDLSRVPNMISIGIEQHQPECPSLQIIEAPKEIKKHLEDVRSKGAKESEIQEILNVETPLLTLSVGFQHILNFYNLKEITISEHQKLKILFSISACRNLPHLSALSIGDCEELVNVVEEDDSNHHHHDMNYSSIFPELEILSISNCNKLEFIFPLSLFGTLQKLKSLRIWRATELKYILGKYDDGDHLSNENESDKLHIHLPALETLSLRDVPKLINIIGTKKYHLISFPSLQSIDLWGHQEFNGESFPDLVAYLQGIQLNVKAPKDLMKIIKDVQNLTKLWVGHSKIEEVLNLEGVEIEGGVMMLRFEEMWLKNLSELRHIFRGPKYILSLPNLCRLNIIACKKLRAIFYASIVKSLPQLSYLSIEDCDELVGIIEESEGDHLHQLYFPKLEEINIKCCNSLKFLFSISRCGMFPKLKVLIIEEASELEQIFMCKQDNMQKVAKMGEVFPKLSNVTLIKLPRLISISEGIDFQDLQHCDVKDCQKYPETSQMKKGPKNGDSESQATSSVLPQFRESPEEAMKTSVEEVASSTDLTKKESKRGTNQQALAEKTSISVGNIQEDIATVKVKTDTMSVEGIAEETTTIEAKIDTSSSYSHVEGSQTSPTTMISKEIEEEFGKAVLALPATSTSLDLEITQSIKDTMEKVLGENEAKDDAVITVRSTNSDSGKQFARPRRLVTKEAKDSGVQQEIPAKLANVPNVISPLHHQTQNADAGPSAISRICEIFQFVQLNDGEMALLAQALKQYPQLLLLPHEQLTNRIIAFAYRVLVDILVLLATKTPYNTTAAEKSTLEANLREAAFVGFDRDWVDSVRERVLLGVGMSDVLAAEEGIQVMEAELGMCDIALEKVRKQSVEAKERIGVARRQLEMAQTEFEGIDSQFQGLLEDRKKLISKISEFKEIISAKDRPFGI